jgi:hypothetical protein
MSRFYTIKNVFFVYLILRRYTKTSSRPSVASSAPIDGETSFVSHRQTAKRAGERPLGWWWRENQWDGVMDSARQNKFLHPFIYARSARDGGGFSSRVTRPKKSWFLLLKQKRNKRSELDFANEKILDFVSLFGFCKNFFVENL